MAIDNNYQNLKEELEAARIKITHYQNELMDSRVKIIETIQHDHEERMRVLEKIATRSNVMYYLTTGGGAMGLIALIQVLRSMP